MASVCSRTHPHPLEGESSSLLVLHPKKKLKMDMTRLDFHIAAFQNVVGVEEVLLGFRGSNLFDGGCGQSEPNLGKSPHRSSNFGRWRQQHQRRFKPWTIHCGTPQAIWGAVVRANYVSGISKLLSVLWFFPTKFDNNGSSNFSCRITHRKLHKPYNAGTFGRAKTSGYKSDCNKYLKYIIVKRID